MRVAAWAEKRKKSSGSTSSSSISCSWPVGPSTRSTRAYVGVGWVAAMAMRVAATSRSSTAIGSLLPPYSACTRQSPSAECLWTAWVTTPPMTITEVSPADGTDATNCYTRASSRAASMAFPSGWRWAPASPSGRSRSCCGCDTPTGCSPPQRPASNRYHPPRAQPTRATTSPEDAGTGWRRREGCQASASRRAVRACYRRCSRTRKTANPATSTNPPKRRPPTGPTPQSPGCAGAARRTGIRREPPRRAPTTRGRRAHERCRTRRDTGCARPTVSATP
jgi:hypothetical protein